MFTVMPNPTPINDAFLELGVSDRAAAELLGVSSNTVQAWRYGRNKIKPTYAKRLHERFGLPLHLLRPDIWDAPPTRRAGSKRAA